MEFFNSLFGNLSSSLQIVLDIAVLVMLAVMLAGKRRKTLRTDQSVIDSFEKIIEETRAISREFGANLEQRQELIQQIIGRLDQRLRESEEMCSRLTRLTQTANENVKHIADAAVPPPNWHSGQNDHQKVVYLANKGLSASEIAKSLKKPLGEVELILNLKKIAS